MEARGFAADIGYLVLDALDPGTGTPTSGVGADIGNAAAGAVVFAAAAAAGAAAACGAVVAALGAVWPPGWPLASSSPQPQGRSPIQFVSFSPRKLGLQDGAQVKRHP